MRVIKGVKYISEDEFDKAVNKVMHNVTEVGDNKDVSPAKLALLMVELAAGFASLSVELFEKNGKETKK